MKALITFLIGLFFTTAITAEWKIDLSRRSKELRKTVYLGQEKPKKTHGIFEDFLNSGDPIQEVVIMNTEKGFVPSSVHVQKDKIYKVYVVNVSEDSKNVSFVMDSFSEHHATYYGKIKSFHIKPKKEGIYSYQCPETSAQGRLVVYPQSYGVNVRAPASAGN